MTENNSPDSSAGAEQSSVEVGDRVTVGVDRPAHGGEGIAQLPDGRIVFVRGGLPGDVLRVEITKVKKRFTAARIIDVVQSSPHRVGQRCPAAARGAGCCDYGHVAPASEDELKRAVLLDQLRRIGRLGDDLPAVESIPLEPVTGWRTRVRLGVDATGHAGTRIAGSHYLLSIPCMQALPGMLDGIVGPGSARFTPGAELIVAVDSTGARHVVESRRAARGRRTEAIRRTLEGSGVCTEKVGEHTYHLPATAFWQAHEKAPETFTATVRSWLTGALDHAADAETDAPAASVGWDLYGGAGLFAPALLDVLRDSSGRADASVISVEQSRMAAECGRAALAELPVEFRTGEVAAEVPQLPAPSAVVLDPPRIGAGTETVSAIAAAHPAAVIHVGCDPATFARDIAAWYSSGYHLSRLAVAGAFPGTHHLEAFGLLVPDAR
ncbi:TRAM domain-containing protein [Corynebacterium sp. CCM 8835]|uniref:Class I SAM-dependent RNA methyltransferase n=1 Tax=Corynebacterium antarcticum TaxID=2800405 RepID=A0ABS1FK27_9CORY|nr:TRAM domain-containing protein [Corynebacterium antarcticum]MCK7641561.1 TRAM domain-containing protein [Corynebacterium antarcticum]MCK7660341.1 TRAM domain-containing protein [Corynebacterium antarcticum]MCL0244789.1 TRAM domain-containing protein [Corynebacterium antarcticum]MCX7491162.1 TRAM domain-containing protein [Corynebacterium antarcticum]MCX7539655.1 TRAM domain-containing protein [Corynebacterium antarcticum]